MSLPSYRKLCDFLRRISTQPSPRTDRFPPSRRPASVPKRMARRSLKSEFGRIPTPPSGRKTCIAIPRKSNEEECQNVSRNKEAVGAPKLENTKVVVELIHPPEAMLDEDTKFLDEDVKPLEYSDDEQYICPFCKTEYESGSQLTKHLRDVHTRPCSVIVSDDKNRRPESISFVDSVEPDRRDIESRGSATYSKSIHVVKQSKTFRRLEVGNLSETAPSKRRDGGALRKRYAVTPFPYEKLTSQEGNYEAEIDGREESASRCSPYPARISRRRPMGKYPVTPHPKEKLDIVTDIDRTEAKSSNSRRTSLRSSPYIGRNISPTNAPTGSIAKKTLADDKNEYSDEECDPQVVQTPSRSSDRRHLQPRRIANLKSYPSRGSGEKKFVDMVISSPECGERGDRRKTIMESRPPVLEPEILQSGHVSPSTRALRSGRMKTPLSRASRSTPSTSRSGYESNHMTHDRTETEP